MSINDSMKAAKKLHENQARVEQLTKDWTEKWKEAKSIMQVGGVGGALSKSGKKTPIFLLIDFSLVFEFPFMITSESCQMCLVLGFSHNRMMQII